MGYHALIFLFLVTIMKFGKINVTVSEEAKNIVLKYQEEHGFGNLDSTMDSFILEKGGK